MSKSSRRPVVRKPTMMCLIINLCFRYIKYTELGLPFSRTDTLNRARVLIQILEIFQIKNLIINSALYKSSSYSSAILHFAGENSHILYISSYKS